MKTAKKQSKKQRDLVKRREEQKELENAYHRGWTQKDKKRIEFYCTILNDLAEQIIIPRRITPKNLIEITGWLQKRNDNLVKVAMGVTSKLNLMAADTALGVLGA